MKIPKNTSQLINVSNLLNGSSFLEKQSGCWKDFLFLQNKYVPEQMNQSRIVVLRAIIDLVKSYCNSWNRLNPKLCYNIQSSFTVKSVKTMTVKSQRLTQSDYLKAFPEENIWCSFKLMA